MCNSTQEKIAIMQAHLAGKPIETRFISGRGGWFTLANPQWDFISREYRIAKSPEEKAFEIYAKAAYPDFNGDWSLIVSKPINAGLHAVINAVKEGKL